MRIACVSDVCVGYGSPQIQSLVTSLAKHYGSAETLIIEPNQPELPPRHFRYPALRIRRAATVSPPYTEHGRIEYVLAAARLLNDYKPDVLVVCCTFCLPVLFKLRRRPGQVVYYSYESITFYGEFDVEMNKHLNGLIDVVVFPEENRAVREVQRFGFRNVPKVVLYNCPDRNPWDVDSQLAPVRNGKVIYCGTIDRHLTLADYYTNSEAQKFSIDLYGPIRARTEEERQSFLNELGGGVQYCGFVGNSELARVRKAYTYSVIMWNPDVENQLYAAPNKLFESIADGVPPISAPHPQCKMLIDRYHCGLLMPDWSFGGFCRTLERAVRICGTPEWQDMVLCCGEATRRELNWNQQFEKLKLYLRN